MDRLPLIVSVSLAGVTDPGEIDTEVYCVNETDDTFTVVVGSTSFTTVDEDHGVVLDHGPPPAHLVLEPGAVQRVATVRGWEWDGHVGVAIEYLHHGSWRRERVSYSLKRPGLSYTIPILGAEGTLILPTWTD